MGARVQTGRKDGGHPWRSSSLPDRGAAVGPRWGNGQYARRLTSARA